MDLQVATILIGSILVSPIMQITCIVGARPQFIKLAPFLDAARKAGHSVRTVHTGQHYDDEMSDVFFRDLDIPSPDLNLGIGSESQAVQTARMMEGLEKDILEHTPDWVVVFGDTNSTLAGALSAAKTGTPSAHIEAGLRSFNRAMPEEINRLVSDHLCDLLFVPSDQGMVNLQKEGLTEKAIRTGDIMADVLSQFSQRLPENILTNYNVGTGEYYLMTLHRPASVDDPDMLRWMLDQVAKLGENVLFPAHPRTRKAIEKNEIKVADAIQLLPALSYLEFQALQAKARGILTDSGGIQKEAYIWKVPCFTLRTETEWTETVEAAWNTIVVPGEGDLAKAVAEWRKPAEHPLLYGDGKSAETIIEHLASRMAA